MSRYVHGLVICALFYLTCNLLSSFEYLYPIENLSGDFFLLFYQKSITDLEVWICDISSGVGCKELSAFFFPSCVKLLPDKSGFSFIDRGKIRIKYFNKRAVHTLSLPDMIYRVIFMHWIDQKTFYMTAQESMFLKTYVCTIDGQNVSVICAQNDISTDFVYPIIFNQALFCIQKVTDDLYHLVKKDDIYSEKAPLQILYTSQKAICSLCVLNEQSFEIFITTIEESDDCNMLYFEFLKINAQRGAEKMFDFCLPKALLTGAQKQRVFESVYPFLPKVYSDGVYFTHAQPNCMPYFYNFKTKTSHRIIVDSLMPETLQCFTPCYHDQNLIFGIGDKDKNLIDQNSGHCLVVKQKMMILSDL